MLAVDKSRGRLYLDPTDPVTDPVPLKMGHDPLKNRYTCTHVPRYFETPGI